MKKEYARYLLKKTKEDYNKIAEKFSKAREKPWPEMEFLVRDFVIPGERILDLGCGNGRLLEFFKDKKIDYIGVDFSERLIEEAKSKYPQAKFQVGDALDLPFPSNYFDKIYSIAVLHHIPSKKYRWEFLKEIRRVLKSDGLLILTVWNLWQKKKTRKLIRNQIFKQLPLRILGKSTLDFRDIQINWLGIKDCYFHCFTKKELGKVVKKAGFKIIKKGKFLAGAEKKFYPKLSNSNFYIVAKKV